MRSIIVACVLLCFVLPAPPTPTPDQFATSTLTAHWTGPRSVELRWDTPGCLYRKPLLSGGVFLGCHAAGAMRLPPGPPADAAYWPAVGDRYLLLTDAGDVWAELGWRVWLPVVENRKATPVFQTWLPLIAYTASI